MKYIITKKQFDVLTESSEDMEGLESFILKFFEENLVPYGGWEKHDVYKKGVKKDDELFFHFSEEWNENNHMWYSICDNHNLGGPLEDDKCPLVTIPKVAYNTLNGYFNDEWIPIFKKWFKNNTGLHVEHVDVIE